MKQSRVLVLLDGTDELPAKHRFFIANKRANLQPRQARRKIQLLKMLTASSISIADAEISLFGIRHSAEVKAADNNFNTNN